MAIDISKQTAKILKNTPFWKDFIDSISTELQNVKDELDIKKNYLDISSYTTNDDLINIARDFGYSTNLVLNEDLDHVQREVSSIYYKIINKASYNFYSYVFKLVPNTGHIYILYKDFSKLIKAVDFATIIDRLNIFTIGNVFIHFNSLQHFDTFVDQPILIDDDPVLEFDPLLIWFFDIDLFVQPTKHLAFEYAIEKLITEGGKDYSLTSKYFDYLERFVKYGKKVIDIPHVGCQHNFVMSLSRFFNLYDITNSNYTISDLKTRYSVTSYFRNESPVVPMEFDSYPTFDFDEEFIWAFDTESAIITQKANEDLFYNLVVGSSTKQLHYKDFPYIDTGLILYTPMDEVKVSNIKDVSINDYNIKTYGGLEKRQGIIGKSIYFNGVDAVLEIPSFQIINSNKQILFWLQSDDLTNQGYNDVSLLYQAGFIDVYYDSILEQLTIELTGSSGTQKLFAVIDYYDTAEHFIKIDVDVDSAMVRLWIDDILNDEDYLTVGNIGSTNSLFIGARNNYNFYQGIIDEVRIYSTTWLTNDYATHMFTKRIGHLKELSNPIYTEKISPNEIYDDGDWQIAFSQIPALSVNKEVLLESDGVTDIITGFLKYPPIVPNYVNIEYYAYPDFLTITDDGLGVLLGGKAEGTINYETGEYSIIFYRDYEEEELISEQSESSINYNTLNQNLTPVSVTLSYWIGDTNYTATDDGSGTITGTGITMGEVDYSTGNIQVTFSSPTDAGKQIIINYTYTAIGIPQDTDVIVSYKTEQDLQITEAGLQDNEGRIVAYATFPPIQFNNIFNHFGSHFMIQKII